MFPKGKSEVGVKLRSDERVVVMITCGASEAASWCRWKRSSNGSGYSLRCLRRIHAKRVEGVRERMGWWWSSGSRGGRASDACEMADGWGEHGEDLRGP